MFHAAFQASNPNTPNINIHNPLYGKETGTEESPSQNWQGSFPKATTVASNVVVVQCNLTTTVR